MLFRFEQGQDNENEFFPISHASTNNLSCSPSVIAINARKFVVILLFDVRFVILDFYLFQLFFIV